MYDVNTKLFKYEVLTIGQFSRNVFWGEKESQAYRSAVCTSTLVWRGKDALVVDPSLPPEQMAETLYNRSGMRPDAVTAVFITHAHGDHYVGVDCFPNARIFMGELELANMRKSGDAKTRALAERILPAKSGFIDGIDLFLMPGHTAGTTAVMFESEYGRVAVCGDGVMTRDFFDARKGYYNSVDFEQAALSIEKLADEASFIVPGHGNYFYNRHKCEQ